MRIRRKLPKPPPFARPLYVIGYSSAPPVLRDLQTWFDLEYGGPIRLRTEGGTSMILASHGPWHAAFRLLLPPEEAESWKARLGWDHRDAGVILPTASTPQQAVDPALHAARLARGLTLLTDGTAYDAATHEYLNPSDWRDRPLDQFRVRDHLTVEQADASESGLDWFSTRGLTKFGLDEIETFRPRGLPSRPVIERLTEIADCFIRLGHAPAVGTKVPLPELGLSVQVTRHRTVPSSALPLSLREITWEEVR